MMTTELFIRELKMRIIDEIMKDSSIELSYLPEHTNWEIKFTALGQVACELSDIANICNTDQFEKHGIAGVIAEKIKQGLKP